MGSLILYFHFFTFYLFILYVYGICDVFVYVCVQMVYVYMVYILVMCVCILICEWYVCIVYICGVYVCLWYMCVWYMFIYAHTCVCVVYASAHKCTCEWRSEVSVRYFLNCSPLYFRRQGFSVNLEFIDWLAWPCRELHRSPVSVSLGLELSGFHGDAGVELRLSRIHSKHFTRWVPSAVSLKNDVTSTGWLSRT